MESVVSDFFTPSNITLLSSLFELCLYCIAMHCSECVTLALTSSPVQNGGGVQQVIEENSPAQRMKWDQPRQTKAGLKSDCFSSCLRSTHNQYYSRRYGSRQQGEHIPRVAACRNTASLWSDTRSCKMVEEMHKRRDVADLHVLSYLYHLSLCPLQLATIQAAGGAMQSLQGSSGAYGQYGQPGGSSYGKPPLPAPGQPGSHIPYGAAPNSYGQPSQGYAQGVCVSLLSSAVCLMVLYCRISRLDGDRSLIDTQVQ